MGVLGLGFEEEPTHGACTRMHEGLVGWDGVYLKR